MSEQVLIEARRLESDHQEMLTQIDADKVKNVEKYAQIYEMQKSLIKDMPIKAFEAFREELERTAKAEE